MTDSRAVDTDSSFGPVLLETCRAVLAAHDECAWRPPARIAFPCGSLLCHDGIRVAGIAFEQGKISLLGCIGENREIVRINGEAVVKAGSVADGSLVDVARIFGYSARALLGFGPEMNPAPLGGFFQPRLDSRLDWGRPMLETPQRRRLVDALPNLEHHIRRLNRASFALFDIYEQEMEVENVVALPSPFVTVGGKSVFAIRKSFLPGEIAPPPDFSKAANARAAELGGTTESHLQLLLKDWASSKPSEILALDKRGDALTPLTGVRALIGRRVDWADRLGIACAVREICGQNFSAMFHEQIAAA